MLYIFSGLPGTGKSELAKHLSQHTGAVYLRIDSIEQTLKDRGFKEIFDEGYQVAFSLAADNIHLGQSVVADSTNPVTASRTAWRHVATQAKTPFVDIEVICSEISEHRHRIESRTSDIPALRLPTWDSVVNREYQPWDGDRLVIDTAGKSPEESKRQLLAALGLAPMNADVQYDNSPTKRR